MSPRVVGLALCAGLALGGCGAKSDSEKVRDTLNTYRNAVAKHDYHVLCTRVLAPAILSRLARYNIPCEQAVARIAGGANNPQLTIGRVTVRGDHATAQVTGRQAGDARASASTIALIRVGSEWRIAATGG